MNVISLNNLWTDLQGLSLTASNQRWLASHLTLGKLSEGVDLEKELEDRWQEWCLPIWFFCNLVEEDFLLRIMHF